METIPQLKAKKQFPRVKQLPGEGCLGLRNSTQLPSSQNRFVGGNKGSLYPQFPFHSLFSLGPLRSTTRKSGVKQEVHQKQHNSPSSDPSPLVVILLHSAPKKGRPTPNLLFHHLTSWVIKHKNCPCGKEYPSSHQHGT